MPRAIRVHAAGGSRGAALGGGPGGLRSGRARCGSATVSSASTSSTSITGRASTSCPCPSRPGVEAFGRGDARWAPGSTGLRLGDRVAYAGGAPGAYSEERVMPADRLVPLPAEIDDRTAAAMMLKGMTAQYPAAPDHPVERRRHHPAFTRPPAGWASSPASGPSSWAPPSSAPRATTRRRRWPGKTAATTSIVYSRESVVERVREITGGKGVRVVYDGVGKDTFMQSLDCLRPRGLLVLFGQSSGPVPPFDPHAAGGQGLPLPHPAGALRLHRHPPASCWPPPGPVRDGAPGRGEDPPRPELPSGAAPPTPTARSRRRRTTGSTVLEV